jgi:hypothetical protein
MAVKVMSSVLQIIPSSLIKPEVSEIFIPDRTGGADSVTSIVKGALAQDPIE